MTKGEKDDMTMWEYYKENIRGSRPLDAFYKDSMEFRESVVYTYDILNRKKAANGAKHDWNAALSAMSMVMDDFDKAFFRFMRKKTEKNAEKFAEMWSEMNHPLIMARNVIFRSNLMRNWNKSKSKYSEWYDDDKEP